MIRQYMDRIGVGWDRIGRDWIGQDRIKIGQDWTGRIGWEGLDRIGIG